MSNENKTRNLNWAKLILLQSLGESMKTEDKAAPECIYVNFMRWIESWSDAMLLEAERKAGCKVQEQEHHCKNRGCLKYPLLAYSQDLQAATSLTGG